MGQLYTAGEELLVELAAGERSGLPDPWLVGLYHTDDDLHDDHTHGAITTEPQYDGPHEVRWPSDVGVEQLDVAGETTGIYTLVVSPGDPIEFDISEATQPFDAYYVAADFRSDRLGQPGERRNLVWTHEIDTSDAAGDAIDPTADDNGVFPLVGVRFGLD